MNQLGNIFREARIKAGKEIEEASRETKIAKKYLEAIENENFNIFPGETYLIGFIRNYAQFLGIDPDEMVIKYKDYKIQEQPVPIEQLTARPRGNKKYLFIAVILLIFIFSGLYILLKMKKEGKSELIKSKEKVEKPLTEKEKSENVLIFEEEELIRDFRVGDIIEFPIGTRTFRISMEEVGDDLKFSLSGIPFKVATDEKVEVDFDRDGVKDLLMRINRLGEGKVNLTLKKIDLQESKIAKQNEKVTDEKEQEIEKKEYPAGPPEVAIIKETDLLSNLPVAPEEGFKVISGFEKTKIEAIIKAVDTSYFSYIIDEGKKEERLLKSGDELKLSAEDILRIMVANAQGVVVTVNNISLTLGKEGEVSAKILRWYRDMNEKNLYHLIMENWEG